MHIFVSLVVKFSIKFFLCKGENVVLELGIIETSNHKSSQYWQRIHCLPKIMCIVILTQSEESKIKSIPVTGRKGL
jgi:hypothetical protein